MRFAKILQTLFQSAQQLYEKSDGSGSGSILLTNGPDPGGPTLHKIPGAILLIKVYDCMYLD